MQECWKIIRKYPGYEVSDMGRVRNVKTGHVLKPFYSTGGYLRVDLGRGNRVKVHRLVALAFCRPRRGKPVVNHKNRDRQDNRACNLEWVTYAENTLHWMQIENEKLAEMRACCAASGDELPY